MMDWLSYFAMYFIKELYIYTLDVLYMHPKVDFPFKYFGNREGLGLLMQNQLYDVIIQVVFIR
jgi:hypothetical protein